MKKRGDEIIAIDNREQNAQYIKQKLESAGVQCCIQYLPYESGCDYLICNEYGSCGIQRKDSTKELILQMDELRHDILPRLISFTDNPVILVEESHELGEMGYLFRRHGNVWLETGMHSSSYYGFLETARMMGVEVVTTRNLDHSIWYMAAMDGYLSREHYPKHKKLYGPYQQSVGMLCCIPGVGLKRAEKALENKSLKEILMSGEAEGLTKKQVEKLQKVAGWCG
jgi:ERCC4-type nuclease